ncbi:MAG: GNAT family N-acetyltransferase [Chloroflexi bacterium]|nr:GNAT family N-acetyltransferase [Chloroflexota bacterium]
MPAIQIRPAIASDIPALAAMDHNYSSDFAWQMEIHADEGRVEVSFRQIHLPRSVRVLYPRTAEALAEDWAQRDGLLTALFEETPVGYISLRLDHAPFTAWVSDLAVVRRMRRQGIGSALLLAAQEWAAEHECRRIALEMQPKNYPALQLAHKLGFEFCGYNDRYFANQDTGLFFARGLR